jgi:L-cystine uptake protein TcyP (sodium:dicarboxylate symporter family)
MCPFTCNCLSSCGEEFSTMALFINLLMVWDDKNNVNLSTFIKCYDGYFIFNVDFNMFLILIEICPLKYYKKV